MKKILIASTALTMLAGAASADVTVSGSGYFGLKYNSKANDSGQQKTQLIDRLQIMIVGSKTTDSGLTFHGKYRIRSNAYQSTGTTSVNAGQVGVTAGGLDVSVGNVSDALDALSLYWNSEIGICGCGGETLNFINGTSGFDGYSSTGGGNNGVLATYTMGDLVVRAAWETGPSTGTAAGNLQGAKGEGSVSVAYKIGALSMEAGYVHRGWSANNLGYSGETLVLEYALGNSNIGIAAGHSVDTSMAGVKGDGITTETLYGNTKFGATTVAAFVSHANNLDSFIPGTTTAYGATSTTYGVGASYDLGSGAAMVGHIRKDWDKGTKADLGVTFSF